MEGTTIHGAHVDVMLLAIAGPAMVGDNNRQERREDRQEFREERREDFLFLTTTMISMIAAMTIS